MSDSGGVTLDSVVINIETQAGQSTASIKNLAESLEGLKKSVKGGFSSLNNLSKYLINLNKSTGKISNIITNVKDMKQVTDKLRMLSRVESPKGVKHAAQSLEDLSKASAKIVAMSGQLASIDGIVKPLQALSNIQKATGLGYAVNKLGELVKVAPEIGKIISGVGDVPKLVAPLQTLAQIESPRGLGAITKNLNSLYSLLEKITPDALMRLTRVSEELAVALTPLADKLASIGNGFSKLQLLADRYGISATRVVSNTSNAKQQTEDLTKQLQKMSNTLKKATSVVNSFGSKAVKQFGKLHSKIKQVGLSLLGTRSLFTAVRKAISEYAQMDATLTKQTTNLWRAMGAQLAPAVEYVLYLFKQFTRVIYSFVYAVTGIDLIARANAKALASMGKAANGALGSLQKFDDLNVVEFNKGEENSLIDLDKIDLSPIQKVIDWVKKLKKEIQDAWNSGNWDGVAKVLAEGINSAFGAINPTAVGNAITNAITGTFDFVTTLISNTNWELIGTKIREVFVAIDWSEIWDHAVKMFKEAFKGIDGFFDGLLGTQLGGEMAASLGGTLLILQQIIGLATGKGFLSGLIEGAVTLFDKIKILGEGFTLLNGNILSTDTIAGITGLSKGVLNLLKPVSDVFIMISNGVASLGLGSVVGIIAAVVVGVMALVTAFKNLWETSEPFRQTVTSLIESIQGTFLGVLDALKGVLTQLWDLLVTLWKEVIVPIFDLIVSIFESVLPALMSVIDVLWRNVLAPVIDGLVKILRPILGVLIDVIKSLVVVVGVVIDVLQWLWTYILEPIVKFLLDIVVGAIKAVGAVVEFIVDFILGIFVALAEGLGAIWAQIKAGFTAAYNFIKKSFVDPILKAWESIVSGLTKAWENIKSSFKNGINSVIGFLNSMINGLNNKLTITINADVAKVLKAIGINVDGGKYSLFKIPTIPKLATGTNEIPYEGLYHLHEGEAVVPKKYNPAIGNGTDEEVGQKLDTLINIMSNMNFTNVVNVGNETLYKKQQKYNSMQNDKYGTTVSL